MSRITVIILFALIALTVNAAPIWEKYSKLTCSGKHFYSCVLSEKSPSCTVEDSTTVEIIDFEGGYKSTLTTLPGLGGKDRILDKRYYAPSSFDSLESHLISLERGGAMSISVMKTNYGNDLISAAITYLGAPSAATGYSYPSIHITYTCYPNE